MLAQQSNKVIFIKWFWQCAIKGESVGAFRQVDACCSRVGGQVFEAFHISHIFQEVPTRLLW